MGVEECHGDTSHGKHDTRSSWHTLDWGVQGRSRLVISILGFDIGGRYVSVTRELYTDHTVLTYKIK